ncbi:antibiotic biosynthesis monooxygenase [Spirosoma jeollabukense]
MARFCLSHGWLLWLPLLPGTLSAVSRFFERSIRPVLARQPGFLEAHFLTEPGKERCLVVTLWASAGCCQRAKSSHACQTAFQQLAEYFAGQPTVACCEVMGQIG